MSKRRLIKFRRRGITQKKEYSNVKFQGKFWHFSFLAKFSVYKPYTDLQPIRDDWNEGRLEYSHCVFWGYGSVIKQTRQEMHIFIKIGARPRNIFLLWKSNNYYVFWMCACSLTYLAHKAHAPLYTAIGGLSGSTVYFPIIS